LSLRGDSALRDRATTTKDLKSDDPYDPLGVQDKVIVRADQGHIRAYRCKDGESVWTLQHRPRICHRPYSDGQRIYFSLKRRLTAVKVEDGTEVWRFGLASCDGPSLILAKQGMVFNGGDDGKLYALDAKTGKKVWASDFSLPTLIVNTLGNQDSNLD